MKVLVVHGRYRSIAPSGENNVVDRESAALVVAGHQVEQFGRDSDTVADWGAARKVALPVRAVWNGEVRRELVARLQASRPDVVHVHNTFPLLSPSVLHACRAVGVPVVATLHNYKLLCASGDFFRDGRPCHDCATGSGLPALAHGCYRGSRAATLPAVTANVVHRRAWRELVSAHVFISSAQRELMAGLGLPAERVFVKHNFVPEPPPSSTADRDGPHQVACVGRLDHAKGLPLLMAAWDHFRRLRPASRLRLAIAGSGPLAEEVGQWAAGHPFVDLKGLLEPAEAARLVARSRAVVVPSQWEETFGLVAVEAMAAGVPPIAPGRGSFPELISHPRDGVLFTPGDSLSLARVLVDVDVRPATFTARGQRARETYVNAFGEADNVQQLLSIYRWAIAHPAGRHETSPSGARP